ncbi:MAG: tRNA (5-methylaminomethyl-2-thiouridine)(34)-methyltransferase MnmD [Crocinitomicaceae bacterium]|nr:tRNA (5-methylaminomethyl-2-thiouridine)(34)-methyltransferase MnmD [Crocinitomicaceae bacterium]
MEKKIIVTGDGSKTIYLPDLDETYHSRHGAVQESQHVFIDSGLELYKNKNSVKIFELGFGTGLNCLLTHTWSAKRDIKIEYTSIEKYPVKEEDLKTLYAEYDQNDILNILHKSNWEEEVELNNNFTLLKLEGDISELKCEAEQFDLVYYDAFGPNTQPELWTIKTLEVIHEIMKPKGVLVTYCAQGQFKRNLKELNFELESIPGPPGKREMTRAIKRC